MLFSLSEIYRRFSKVKISFRWKVSLFLSALTVTITSIGFFYYYSITYDTTIFLIHKNLNDVGTLSIRLFDDEKIQALKRLKNRAFEESSLDKMAIEKLAKGASHRTIDFKKAKEIHRSDDFKLVHQFLQQITISSYRLMRPDEKYTEYAEEVDLTIFDKGGIVTYIMADLSTHDSAGLSNEFGMYLANNIPDPIPPIWPGNPIGNVFHSYISFESMANTTVFNQQVFTDDFYQYISTNLPIYDKNGEIIAFLGLEYSVGQIFERLDGLKQVCAILILISFIGSVIVAFVLSKPLLASFHKLIDGATQIGEDDFSVRIIVNNNDEFGLLGLTFNKMAENVERTFARLADLNENLENQVKERTYNLQATNIELDEQKKILESVLKNQGDFFLRIAHELRTPLPLIRTPVEQLLATKQPLLVQENLSLVQKSISRLQRLIDQMLEAATSGKGYEPGIQVIDLVSVVEPIIL